MARCPNWCQESCHVGYPYQSAKGSASDVNAMGGPISLDDDLTAVEANARVGAGKAISFWMKMETLGYVGVEKGSVYGAAVAIPQIARSVGYSTTFNALMLRSYVFLLLNYLLQGFILSTIGEEGHLMNPFKGKVHLCNFGANTVECPGSPDCTGPANSTYSLPRLYDFTTWSNRAFFTESLKALFPDMAADISKEADPGEYGLENYYCRVACCLVFLMGCCDDLQATWSLAMLIWHAPTKAERWISYQAPDELPDGEEHGISPEHVKALRNETELDLVKFHTAGMPLCWKLANVVVVLIPKFFIWCSLVSAGFHYLMETAGICDLIVNSMALAFILEIDEMIFSRLATTATKYMMENIEDMPLFSTDEEETETDEMVLHRFNAAEFGPGMRRKMISLVFPRRLLTILILFAVFYFKYYVSHCTEEEDGSWVSKPMYWPELTSYNPIHYLVPGFVHESSHLVWAPPDAHD